MNKVPVPNPLDTRWGRRSGQGTFRRQQQHSLLDRSKVTSGLSGFHQTEQFYPQRYVLFDHSTIGSKVTGLHINTNLKVWT